MFAFWEGGTILGMRKSTALLTVFLMKTALAMPAANEPAKSAPAAKAEPRPLEVPPEGSADYSKMLALAVSYKKGAITFDKLTQLVVAAKLPPHPLGDEYLMMPVPAPPPGVPFDPALMPKDWEHTFGEVAMTYFASKISREEYDRLHAAAHRNLPGFPNCGHKKR